MCRDSSRRKKSPNAWNLYDMLGNVGELCHDGYQASGSSSTETDPLVPSDTDRAGRGAGWDYFASGLRAAARNGGLPTESYRNVGFRCVRTLLP
jgi:formylglycine-generating enzyme required for sulfatase activity